MFWTLFTAISARLVQFATTLLLARLLVPEDFGVVAVAMVIINSLALLRDMGVSQALIQRQEDIEEAADSAFVLLPLTGTALSALIMVLAPAIGDFFDIPQSVAIIRVLAIGLVISSFGLVPSTLLQKDLRFKRRFIPEIAPIGGYCLVATVTAFSGWGAWSLVAGELTRNIMLATAIWPFSTWRPKLRFNWVVAKSLLTYGWHIMTAGVAIFLFTTIDNLGVAKALGTEQLGFYVLAFTIGTMPATQMAHAFSLVLFPAFSRIQGDKVALCQALTRTISYNTALTAPIALATLSLGPVMLTTFYGDKWSGAVVALQILSIYGFFRAAAVSSGEILKSIGAPNLLARVTYVQLLLVVALLYPTVVYGGINGVAVLFTMVIALCALGVMYIACRAIGCSYLKALSGTLMPLSMAGVSALLAWLIASVLMGGSSLAALMAGTVAYIVSYLILILIFNRRMVTEMKSLVKGALPKSAG